MPIPVSRINLRLDPDHKKVIPRFLNTGHERSLMIIDKVFKLSEEEAVTLLDHILNEFSNSYRNIENIFTKHFELIRYLVPDNVISSISPEKRLLLGSYFTMEYSIEAAALFNPSIVEDPDQRGAGVGQKKVIISLRATGESHISSLVFRDGLLDEQGMIHFEPPGKFIAEGLFTPVNKDTKVAFQNIMSKLNLPPDLGTKILQQLPDPFTYVEMEVVLKEVLMQIESPDEKSKIKYKILKNVNTCHELTFPKESLVSERVIFPVTYTERNGIEDARFVKFTEDDGTTKYIGTYTAYDGFSIAPQLIITNDFLHFSVSPLHGKAAINKNLALFPRKINGQYAMLSRIDGMNNYIMFSDDLYLWEEATLLQKPRFPWEYIQVGNAGSPIETEKGWLVITHGVGAMRKYCLGASLFDLENPTKELGRLREPFLVPNEEERDGYVPNVVYSCGSIIHGDKLFVPYAVSDHAVSFATVPIKVLLDEILKSD